jgi:hypothetical protein
VPVVLNKISSTESAMKPSLRSGVGACLPSLMTAAAPAFQCAAVLARPRNVEAVRADWRGPRFSLVADSQVEAYQPDSQTFAHTTLTIADGAGDLGSHPAREPV